MKSFKQFISEVLEKKSGQLGTNPGGTYHDTETGDRHYIKFPNNPDQARAEVLSSRLQRLMGINTLEPELKDVEGRTGVSTRWREGLTPVKLNDVKSMTPEQHKHLGKMFAHGVLTKNWDTVGTGLDYGQGNVSTDKEGNLHGVDPGGSFHFRAQGANKPYTTDIPEVYSLRDPNVNRESAHVFNTAFKKTPEALTHAVESVKNLNNDDIHQAFRESGLPNWETLHSTFLKRKENFLNHFKNP